MLSILPCSSNSSLSSLPSTSHTVHGEGGLVGEGVQQGEGMGVGGGEGAGDISSTLPYTALAHGASPLKGLRTTRHGC